MAEVGHDRSDGVFCFYFIYLFFDSNYKVANRCLKIYALRIEGFLLIDLASLQHEG